MVSKLYVAIELLLTSEYGIEEGAWQALCDLANEQEDTEARLLLYSADATDGWFYLNLEK